jgi:hypothetical protein
VDEFFGAQSLRIAVSRVALLEAGQARCLVKAFKSMKEIGISRKRVRWEKVRDNMIVAIRKQGENHGWAIEYTVEEKARWAQNHWEAVQEAESLWLKEMDLFLPPSDE